MRNLSFALLFLCLASACVSSKPRYQINVGNGSPTTPIRDVRLSVDGREWGSFNSIAPNKLAASKPRSGDAPKELGLSWVDAEGKAQSTTVSALPLTAGDFRGQLVVQIDADQSVKVTPVPSTDSKVSILPWAVPEAWEGSIGIPGMDQN
jgi:hypothetical protein